MLILKTVLGHHSPGYSTHLKWSSAYSASVCGFSRTSAPFTCWGWSLRPCSAPSKLNNACAANYKIVVCLSKARNKNEKKWTWFFVGSEVTFVKVVLCVVWSYVCEGGSLCGLKLQHTTNFILWINSLLQVTTVKIITLRQVIKCNKFFPGCKCINLELKCSVTNICSVSILNNVDHI